MSGFKKMSKFGDRQHIQQVVKNTGSGQIYSNLGDS
jgi:hypothetical protein